MIAFAGIDGFLPWRASFMLDVVFLSMFVVLPVLGWSILLVRRGEYRRHKQIQISLGIVLLAAVGLFELDMQIYGWEHRAEDSRFYANGVVTGMLWVHLVFAVSTAVLWTVVVARALRRFPIPPRPAEHSRWHVPWARLAAWDMALTALTGWVFYVMAFVL